MKNNIKLLLTVFLLFQGASKAIANESMDDLEQMILNHKIAIEFLIKENKKLKHSIQTSLNNPNSMDSEDNLSVMLKYSNDIRILRNDYKLLQGRMEEIQEQQKNNTNKIAELFNLQSNKKVQIQKKQMKSLIKKDNLAKKTYIDARSLLVAEQYDQSIAMFKRFIASYPDSAYVEDAYYWLAKSYLAQEDYNNAEINFVKFQQNNPLNNKYANSLFELAVIYIKMDKNEKAVTLLNTIVKKFPYHLYIKEVKELIQKINTTNSAI